MLRGIRTTYSRELNKWFGTKFQEILPEEGRSVQRRKRHEYGNKFEANNPNNLNCVNSIKIDIHPLL